MDYPNAAPKDALRAIALGLFLGFGIVYWTMAPPEELSSRDDPPGAVGAVDSPGAAELVRPPGSGVDERVSGDRAQSKPEQAAGGTASSSPSSRALATSDDLEAPFEQNQEEQALIGDVASLRAIISSSRANLEVIQARVVALDPSRDPSSPVGVAFAREDVRSLSRLHQDSLLGFLSATGAYLSDAELGAVVAALRSSYPELSDGSTDGTPRTIPSEIPILVETIGKDRLRSLVSERRLKTWMGSSFWQDLFGTDESEDPHR